MCDILVVFTGGVELHICVGDPLEIMQQRGVPWELTLPQCRQVYNESHQCLLPCPIPIQYGEVTQAPEAYGIEDSLSMR